MLTNLVNKIKNFYRRHFWDIVTLTIALLVVLALVGIWRLRKITPPKTVIRIETAP